MKTFRVVVYCAGGREVHIIRAATREKAKAAALAGYPPSARIALAEQLE